MDDLVRKLRENAEIVPHDTYMWFNPLLNEAADKIESNAKVIAALRGAIENVGSMFDRGFSKRDIVEHLGRALANSEQTVGNEK
jgi:hypothetical protein